MIFHPPSDSHRSPSTDHTSQPSFIGCPQLSSTDSFPTHHAQGSVTYASRVATSTAYKASTIPPIGTERISPTKAVMTRLHGRDAEITERRESNSGDTTLVSEPPHDYIPEYCNDADGAQAQKVWNELYLLRQQGSLGQQAPQYGQDHSNPYAALQSHPSNYLEDIAARYRKSQEDEISLRHAEDLAAGRVEPSGEGGFHPPPGPSDPSNTTVFVGGLHHNVTEPELFKFFQPFGQISYVKIPPGKGCGFVQYVEKRCAELALGRMQGFMLNGCKIRLSWGKTGPDKASRAQEAHLRTLAALQGLNSMSPEYMDKLAIAMQIVSNETHFRQIMAIHEHLVNQGAVLPLEVSTMRPTSRYTENGFGSHLAGLGRDMPSPVGASPWRSWTLPGMSNPARQTSRPQNEPLYGMTPFSSSISPPSASQRLPLQYQGVERTSDHGDGLMHDSPSRAPTGLPTPGFPSSFSSLHSLNSAPALSSSSSQSQFNTSPGSATSNKFERAFAMSPHKFDDTHLFEPFGISPPNHDYTRSYGGRLSQGSLQLSSSIETVRPRASSVVIPPAPDLSYKLGGLNLGRNGSNARSVHPFGNAFSPLPSAHHKPESRK